VSAGQRVGNILGVALPVVAFAAAIVLLWNDFVGPEALAIMVLMYLVTGGLGISVGFHRLFAHRSFEAVRPVRGALAIFGTMAMMGPIIRWVTNHRKHHSFTDTEGDPHSPHLGDRTGVLGSLTGLWHAHVGWIFRDDRAPRERYARDLLADPLVAFVDRTAALWVALGFALPFALGLAVTASLEGALIALLWGGPVRIFIVPHLTFSINSLCHFTGRRRFATGDESRNVSWLAPLAFGESWHNNHHAFPSSAFLGLRRRELDPGGWVIRGLARLGLVSSVKHPSAHGQELKLLPKGTQREIPSVLPAHDGTTSVKS
jgi:stearoyl-CoA desaturase (delta-9 desaturase)